MVDSFSQKLPQAKGILQNLVVVVSLVHTLMDSFGSASDLYKKLKRKEKRIEEDVEVLKERHGMSPRRRSDSDDSDERPDRHGGRSRRSRSRGSRRSADYSDSDEESMCTSGALVRQEYERGYRHLGQKFAVGDLITQNQLQAQIIAMQQTIITIFQECALIYGPRTNPVSHHLATLLNTTRAARSGSIEALALQYQRMLTGVGVPEGLPAPPLEGVTNEIVIRTKPRARDRSMDSNTTTRTGPTAITEREVPRGLFCMYAVDLQKHADQPLADAYKEGGDGRCPYCKFRIPTRPGKAWEIVKEDERSKIGRERVFLLENRFVVKSHRDGGPYACVLCSVHRENDTVCDSVAALVDHVWQDHLCGEFEKEVNIVEVG
ncbi:uncharacterized protein BDR25DRAFT_65895 [Lindgomyces ingoldianus]|uniref:Uncharacterized protein n=1 Tax=Lindgomyces ingoldianus TaxID=673940 RepID=A0ACB6RCD2_9PLEO|nr:uncharacterized protein BDR25DRAFT_65895 [Lindgomyces ingoldianus]KAF2476423.1 hypothetical protein BDR25DRAFT_65895 [Lindgomyces ingoldianus]